MTSKLQTYNEWGQELAESLMSFSLDLIHLVATYAFYASPTEKAQFCILQSKQCKIPYNRQFCFDSENDQIWKKNGIFDNDPWACFDFQSLTDACSTIKLEKNCIKNMIVAKDNQEQFFIIEEDTMEEDEFITRRLPHQKKMKHFLHKSLFKNCTILCMAVDCKHFIVAMQNINYYSIQIIVFDRMGKHLREFSLYYASNVCSMTLLEDKLLLTESNSNYFQIMDLFGKNEKTVYLGKKTSQLDLDVDLNGNIFATANYGIFIYSSKGDLIRSISHLNFTKPLLMTRVNRQGQVYVVCQDEIHQCCFL